MSVDIETARNLVRMALAEDLAYAEGVDGSH